MKYGKINDFYFEVKSLCYAGPTHVLVETCDWAGETPHPFYLDSNKIARFESNVSALKAGEISKLEFDEAISIHLDKSKKSYESNKTVGAFPVFLKMNEDRINYISGKLNEKAINEV